MPVRKLTPREAEQADALIELIKMKMSGLAGSDGSLLLAVRRRVRARLAQWEGSSTIAYRKLHAAKYEEQGGRCASCGDALLRAEAHIQLLDPTLNPSPDNAKLVHISCMDAKRLDAGPDDRPTGSSGREDASLFNITA